jgi:tetratricopeptide (TPR) repeat protein
MEYGPLRGYTPGKHMRLLVAASLLVLAIPPSWGAPEQAPSPQAQLETQPDKPAPQLVALERLLSQKQESRDTGVLPPEQYQRFVVQFRSDLDTLMPRIPSTPANQGLHALILSRLGGQDHATAVASLTQALKTKPDDPELLRTQGQILYEQRDFPAAAESARQAWEASGHKDKAAWALLKMSEGRVSGMTSTTGSTARASPASLDWTIPMNNDISPKAMGHIEKAIASRKQGDLAATWVNAQAAMNADPTSTAVQKFYETVRAERVQTQETHAFIQNAVQALSAGHGEEAVSWARRAYERSPGEDTRGILEDVMRRSAAVSPNPTKTPTPKPGSPLMPLAGALGFGAIGYGIAKSRNSWSEEESERPENEDPNCERIQGNRRHLRIAAISAVIGFGVVYGGPILWRAAAPTVVALARGGQQSFQRVATSEAGALLPEEQVASQRLSTLQKLPWNSWAQSPKEIVNGKEYAKIGERLYTQHAVEHMMPRGLNIGSAVEGRSMSPTFVEDVILRGTRTPEIREGVQRTIHRLGTAEIVTEQGGRIVVTVNPYAGGQ